MENYRFDPYTGRPLSPPSMPPRTWGAYPPRGLPQAAEPPLSQSPAEQSNVIVTRVADYDEAKAVPTDFSGVLRLMLDWSHGYIYAKDVGDDGIPVFRKFRFEPEAPAPAPGTYLTIEEGTRLIREETAAAMRAMREEFASAQPPVKELKEPPEKNSGKGSKA